MSLEVKEIKTAPFDARFPNTNQTKNCWQNYVDYYKCIDAKGASFGPCRQFRKVFTSLCPTKWVENWDEQREKGTFPAFYKDPTRGTAHGSGDDHGAAGGHH